MVFYAFRLRWKYIRDMYSKLAFWQKFLPHDRNSYHLSDRQQLVVKCVFFDFGPKISRWCRNFWQKFLHLKKYLGVDPWYVKYYIPMINIHFSVSGFRQGQIWIFLTHNPKNWKTAEMHVEISDDPKIFGGTKLGPRVYVQSRARLYKDLFFSVLDFKNFFMAIFCSFFCLRRQP